MSYKKLPILFFLLFLFASSVQAQKPTCPPNIDFEMGNLSFWDFFNGLVAAGPVYTLTPTTPVPGREDLMFGSAVDPYGFFPVVGAGKYSCKLGHDTALYCAERARYNVHVPSGTANYSLIYHYAMVLEDGTHPASTQPRFEVSAYDSATGSLLPCAQFDYVVKAGVGLPGFNLSTVGFDVYYRNWSTGSMNLSGFGGKTVTIDFTAADCGAGGHFGYGYLDMDCGLFAITNVSCNSANITLTGPAGYQSYQWVDSATYSIIYGTTDTITIPTPGGPTTFAVILTPYVGYGCPDTLYTRVYPTSLKIHPSDDTTICVGNSVMIHTGATDIALPLTYTWSSSSGTLSCSTCDSTIVTPPLGTSTYIFSVTDIAGCSQVDSVHVTAQGVVPAVKETDVSCFGLSDGTASAYTISGAAPITYKWSTTPVQTGVTATGLSVGTYTVAITDKSGCTDNVSVTVSQPPPTVIAIAGSSSPTTCKGHDGTITISGFVPSTSFTITYLFNGAPISVTLMASSTGIIILTGLSSGTYSNITVTGTKCPYNTIGPVVLTDPPIPPPPPVTPQIYCQYAVASQLVSSGSNLLWYGPGITPGLIIAPTPLTLLPTTIYYFVTQTVKGCVSDSAIDSVIIIPKPAAPLTIDTTYCQFAPAVALTATGQNNKWYKTANDGKVIAPPVPSTDTSGTATWYVTQTVDGCESDPAPLNVITLFKPEFNITPQQPFVCQYDSIWLGYSGPLMDDPAYVWSTFPGTHYSVNPMKDSTFSIPTDSMIYVRFDSVVQNNYIRLFASDYHGRCSSDTFLRITVVPHPTATSVTKVDVCVGDTVNLALGSKSENAALFSWQVDNTPMETSNALTIITHNSNSGGPFGISWNDSGRHVILVKSTTVEGCTAPPTADTVDVHNVPDATFRYETRAGELCLEDSVLFEATATSYNYSYAWMPAHYFSNVNKGVTWGKVENSASIVTLLVTDPFGCAATTSQELDPGSCCTVAFPTSFTPSDPKNNRYFRPIFVGYHRFHIFRIENRWGETVYESTNNDMKWDGNYNGVPMKTDVYFYYLQFDCGGKTMEQKGDVTLIR